MKSTPKQIVMDKDVFQGTDQAIICEFAKSHFLILPDVLLYECLTDPERESALLRRFEQVISAGAYVCPSVKTILFKEAKKLSPYRYLPDMKLTTDIRISIEKNLNFIDSDSIQQIYNKQCEKAEIRLESAPKTVETIASHEPKLLEEARKYQDNRAKRFMLWVETVTSNDIHKLVIEKLGYLTETPERFCLWDEWITWHYFCLICVIYLEYTFLKIIQGEAPSLKKAENDCQDIGYVSYLALVDGLITRDKKLVKPVAIAAFPDKDVFSNLEEVPDEYLCHWD